MRRIPAVLLLMVACSGRDDGKTDPSNADGGPSTGQPGETGTPDDGDGDGPGTGTAPGTTTGEDGEVGDPPIIFDVGGASQPPDKCENQPDGAYCKIDQRTQYTCLDGKTAAETICNPDFCFEGACVDCLTGMNACQGNRVVSCNDANNTWDEVEVCDAAAGQGCDLGLVTCVDLQPIGDTTPTGQYYKYADFATGAVYQGGCDVDGFDNRLYVSGGGSFETWVSHVDVYEVEIVDSDNDGHPEPDQHPDNPDDTGPIEERVLTHIEEIPLSGNIMYLQASEIYAYEDKLLISGQQLVEVDLDTYEQTVIATAPTWATGAISGWPYSVSFLGYDEVHDEWFAGNESDRRTFRYHPDSDSWGLAFRYPFLAGAHMDGMEVVTDPATGISYVYVSDMTSDFIGQYYEDAENGWVQQNLFSYAAVAADVEGLGFGPFGHFWVSSLAGTLYELGGGELGEYLPDPDPAG
jgi:hypothetical protein